MQRVAVDVAVRAHALNDATYGIDRQRRVFLHRTGVVDRHRSGVGDRQHERLGDRAAVTIVGRHGDAVGPTGAALRGAVIERAADHAAGGVDRQTGRQTAGAVGERVARVDVGESAGRGNRDGGAVGLGEIGERADRHRDVIGTGDLDGQFGDIAAAFAVGDRIGKGIGGRDAGGQGIGVVGHIVVVAVGEQREIAVGAVQDRTDGSRRTATALGSGPDRRHLQRVAVDVAVRAHALNDTAHGIDHQCCVFLHRTGVIDRHRCIVGAGNRDRQRCRLFVAVGIGDLVAITVGHGLACGQTLHLCAAIVERIGITAVRQKHQATVVQRHRGRCHRCGRNIGADRIVAEHVAGHDRCRRILGDGIHVIHRCRQAVDDLDDEAARGCAAHARDRECNRVLRDVGSRLVHRAVERIGIGQYACRGVVAGQGQGAGAGIDGRRRQDRR